MPAQMTSAQARVIDPILTNVARGYQNNELVGGALFPTIPVGKRGGKIIVFDKTSFKLFATDRSPGENVRRVRFGRQSDPYSLTQHALEGEVAVEDLEESQDGPGIDEAFTAVSGVANIIALRKERAQAALATNAALYPVSNKVTLTLTDQWSDPASTPVNDIEAAKDAIRSKTGKRPNTLVLGPTVFSALKTNPQIIDRIKYTGRDVPTLDLLASLFGVANVVSGDAVQASDDDVLSDVWGKFAVLAFTQVADLRARGVPSFGYTYQLKNYPIAKPGYYEENTNTWYYQVMDECSPVIAGSDAGFLFSGAVA